MKNLEQAWNELHEIDKDNDLTHTQLCDACEDLKKLIDDSKMSFKLRDALTAFQEQMRKDLNTLEVKITEDFQMYMSEKLDSLVNDNDYNLNNGSKISYEDFCKQLQGVIK